MRLEEVIAEPFYMHVGRKCIVVWNRHGKTAVHLSRRKELEALNPMKEPHLVKETKTQYKFLVRHRFYRVNYKKQRSI